MSRALAFLLEMFDLPVQPLTPVEETPGYLRYERHLTLPTGSYTIQVYVFRHQIDTNVYNNSLLFEFQREGRFRRSEEETRNRSKEQIKQEKNELLAILSNIVQMLDYIVPTFEIVDIGFSGSLNNATPRPHRGLNSRIGMYDRFARILAKRYNGRLRRNQDESDVEYVIRRRRGR